MKPLKLDIKLKDEEIKRLQKQMTQKEEINEKQQEILSKKQKNSSCWKGIFKRTFKFKLLHFFALLVKYMHSEKSTMYRAYM